MQITRNSWKYHVTHGDGTVNVTPEDSDDIWALYNIIAPGDEVECVTLRKVLQESSSGEVIDSQKMKMVLAVKVEKIDVDLQTPVLRVNGRNVKENPHVKLGSYHTLDVAPDRWLKLSKQTWDSLSIEILNQALSSVGKVEIGAIVMQEGLACICSMTPNGTRVLNRVEVSMPKKKFGPTSASEKALEKFMTSAMSAFLENVKFDQLKAIIIGGVGTLKEDFYRRLMEKAQKEDLKAVLGNKGKFIRVTVFSGEAAALTEVLKEPRVAVLLADTRAAQETRVLEAYHKMHNIDAERTTYGPKQVLMAAEQCAVKSLLISDSLFRSQIVKDRKMYGKIIGTVKENGGEVVLFATGSKLELELSNLTGIAAILNFPIIENIPE